MKNIAIEHLVTGEVKSVKRLKRVIKIYSILTKNKHNPFSTNDGTAVYSITRKELATALKLEWDTTSCSAARILSDDIKLLAKLNLIQRVHSENQILYIVLELGS